MNKFKQWYLNNYTEITWFLIGFLTLAGFTDLSRGDYVGAIISFALAIANYLFSRR